jgi:hypothetical protein
VRTAVAMAIVATTIAARADSTDLVARPLVLAPGELQLDLVISANARSHYFARPLSLSPDAWFGVTPELTVGIIHSARSVDEITADRPLCVRDCELTYAGGIEARYGLHRMLAPRVRLLLRDVDPVKPAMTLGALAKWQRGRFAIESDPYLRLGLANTDKGNRATLMLPVQLAVQPTCKWLLGVRFGYDSALAVWRDGYRVPMAYRAAVHPLAPLTIAGEVGYKSLIGPQHEFRERTVMLTISWQDRVR